MMVYAVSARSPHAGAWTEWVSMGTFVGTRGRTTCLLGFCMRLSDALLEEFEGHYTATFIGHATAVTVPFGAECRVTPDAALESLKITLRTRSKSDTTAASLPDAIP